MKDIFMPRTALGRWSVGFIVAFFLFTASFLIIAASGERGGDTLSSNMALASPMMLAAFCGVIAFITGASSIMKCNTWRSRKEPVILSGYGKTIPAFEH